MIIAITGWLLLLLFVVIDFKMLEYSRRNKTKMNWKWVLYLVGMFISFQCSIFLIVWGTLKN